VAVKTVRRETEIKRVGNEEAAKLVKKGWSYCPKADWKRQK